MARITILDPTASPPDVDADPGPAFDSSALAAARIGIRYDQTWRSFDWVRSEWEEMFIEQGASVSQWCAGDRTGDAAELTLKELSNFAGQQEVVLSGLGN